MGQNAKIGPAQARGQDAAVAAKLGSGWAREDKLGSTIG